ncbi:hypothetical protein KAI87_01195, partial [Myxococcota bacterium]|nr:hypothetical protein [Myxococcota bacterium]
MSLLTTILPTLMTLMLSSPASQDSLAPYRGLPVLSIEIVDQQGETVTNLRSLIDIERGYILAKRDIQTALKRLYAL